MKSKIKLKVSKDDKDVAYLKLPDYGNGFAEKTVRLRDIINSYQGPDIYLDFDSSETLIGIEILV